MGALTEQEIFDRMSESLKAAAECARDLATLPIKGPTYDRFRKELRLIEGCCRQASAWREDTRWLKVGMLMAETHQRAGNMLRGYREPDGTKRVFAQGTQFDWFSKLATNLVSIKASCDALRTSRTGRTGMILPETGPAPHRDHRPVGWRSTESGLVIPA